MGPRVWPGSSSCSTRPTASDPTRSAFREHLAASLPRGGANVGVAVTSATRDGDTRELRDLDRGVEAKRAIADGSRRSCRTRRSTWRRAPAVRGGDAASDRRAADGRTCRRHARSGRHHRSARAQERQAIAATRLAARPRGAGPPACRRLCRATIGWSRIRRSLRRWRESAEVRLAHGLNRYGFCVTVLLASPPAREARSHRSSMPKN